jgi:hypothetical protein
MTDPLKDFLQRNAPQPPAGDDSLEERILAAMLAPQPRRFFALPGGRNQWVAAASVALVLLGGLSLLRPQQLVSTAKAELTLDSSDNPQVFAVDPQTDLYEVRF